EDGIRDLTVTGVQTCALPILLRGARKELGLTTDQTIVIGDTMETDIIGGAQLGFKTILVLSGGTRREDLVRYAFRPDKVVDSIRSEERRVGKECRCRWGTEQ